MNNPQQASGPTSLRELAEQQTNRGAHQLMLAALDNQILAMFKQAPLGTVFSTSALVRMTLASDDAYSPSDAKPIQSLLYTALERLRRAGLVEGHYSAPGTKRERLWSLVVVPA